MAEVPRFAGAALELGMMAHRHGETGNPGPQVEAFQVALGGISGLYDIADRPGDPASAKLQHEATVRWIGEEGGQDPEDLVVAYADQVRGLGSDEQIRLDDLHRDLGETIANRRQVTAPEGLVVVLGDEAEIVTDILAINGGRPITEPGRFRPRLHKVVRAGRLQDAASNLYARHQNQQTGVSFTGTNLTKLETATRLIGQGKLDARNYPGLVRFGRELTPAAPETS